MTAPETVEAPVRQDLRRHHKLCALQALAATLAMPRITLCGMVLTGPRRPHRGAPPCPLCFDVVDEHRATCPACQRIWGASP